MTSTNRPILTLKRKTPAPTEKAIHAKPYSADDVINTLVDMFPLAFFPRTKQKKPLALGIQQQIFSAETGLSRKAIRSGLFLYVNRTSYIKSVSDNAMRINLDGSEDAMVSLTHVIYSREELVKRGVI